MDEKEKALRLKMSDTYPRLHAKNANEGKEYLTVGMLYKIKVVKINGTNLGCTSVTVESESNLENKHLNIAGNTELIAYDKDLHIPSTIVETPTENIADVIAKDVVKISEKEKAESTKEEKKSPTKKVPDTGKAKKINMSGIINPLLLEGKTAEEIADAVIAAHITEGVEAPDRANLIRQIRGPRKYNLIKKLEKDGKEVPKHLTEKDSK